MDDNMIDLSKFAKGRNEAKLNETVLEGQFIAKYAEYHEYNDKGQVIYTYDTNGKSIKYTYDEKGNNISRELKDGTIITMVYDENNKLISRRDSRGFTEEYEYNSNGNLTKTELIWDTRVFGDSIQF